MQSEGRYDTVGRAIWHGGASVYAQALPLADRLCLTEVDDTPANADTFFPEYKADWQETWRENHDTDERHAQRYSFVDYEKKIPNQ